MAQIRLNKYLAGAGIASRRKADELITQGQVKVNGKIVKDLGSQIDPEKDQVEYRGKLIRSATFLLFMFNKPVGVTSTIADKHALKTIADYFKNVGRVYPVGRLDKNSEGLILITNNGDLANQLTHPKYEHEKEYEVLISGQSINNVKRFGQSFILNNYKTRPMKFKLIKKISQDKWLIRLILQEGRKRQIRRVAEILGYKVVQLKRVRIGKLKLGNLSAGQYQPININDII